MTILYRIVPILSGEHAASLPIGTVATSAQEAGGVWRKCAEDSWVKASSRPSLWTNCGMANPDAAISAHVPIEAVVQHVSPDAITYSRYVTAWEEA